MGSNENSSGGSIETAEAGLSEAKRNLLLAKMLLEKYGAIHAFHTEQLQRYTIACCDYAISGNVSIFPDDKKVVFDIKTKKDFYVKNSRIQPRFKFSPMKLVYLFKYSKETDVAVLNLKTWTRELLWSNTAITVIIDGELYYGKAIEKKEENES